jgi:hypothetical protein
LQPKLLAVLSWVYDSPSDRDRPYGRYRCRDYSNPQRKLLTALARSQQTNVSTPSDRRSGVYSRMQTETPYIKRKRKPKRITYSSIFGILRGHEMRAANARATNR